MLPLGSGAHQGGLFLEASRINHSCRHNAQNTWNANIERLTIYAFCDIEEGQEITISYLGGTSDYAERQRDLKKKFKFDCKCELCSLPPAQREESDSRLNKIKSIDEAIGDFVLEPEMKLHLIHIMFGLFEEEGIWDARIPRAYYDAYQIAIASGDKARARTFAKRAYAARAVIEGDDSPNTTKLKRLAEQPSEPINDGPPEMSEDELENWLWKEKEWSEHLTTSSSEDAWSSSTMGFPTPDTWASERTFEHATDDSDSGPEESCDDDALIMQILRDGMSF